MAIEKEEAVKREAMKKQSVAISTNDLPRVSIEETIPILKLMYDNIASGTIKFDEIAKLMGSSPKTTKTKHLIWGADAYGLIIKDEKNEYRLSETGRKIVAPTYPGENEEAFKKAILIPTILSKFYLESNNYPLPQEQFLDSKLENKYMIPRDRIEEAKRIILDNARLSGVLIKKGSDGKEYIILEQNNAKEKTINSAEMTEEKVPEEQEIHIEDETYKDICFVICPIGDDDSIERKHSDMFFKHLIEPVLIKFNMKVIRSDKIEKTGLINQQILQYITKSKLCIADLSFSNPNVFYELGVRHTCLLPTIQIIKKGDKIPFDVSQGRTIKIDTSDPYTLIDRIESGKKELEEHVKGILEKQKEYVEDNPIRTYIPGIKVTF